MLYSFRPRQVFGTEIDASYNVGALFDNDCQLTEEFCGAVVHIPDFGIRIRWSLIGW